MSTIIKKIFSNRGIRYASVGSVVNKFGATLFAFVNGILLARFLDLDEFGYYLLALSTITLLSIPITAGIPFLITRYVSKYVVNDNYKAIKGLLIKTGQYALFAIAAIYLISFVTYWFWWKTYDSVLVETLLYGFILLPLLGLGALRSAALRGLKLVILAEMPDSLIKNLLLFLFIIVMILFQVKLTPQLVMIFQVIAALIGFLIGYYFLSINLLVKVKNISPEFHNKEWLKQTIPFSINSGIQIIKSRSLTYMLAIFGSIEAVALFEVSLRGASLVSFVLDALNNAISPFVSAAYEKKNYVQLERIVKKMGRIVLLFSLPVALIFILGGKSLLTFVFGEGYSSSYFPLIILCTGQLISTVVGCVGLLLNMTGHQSIFSRNNVIFLGVNFTLSIPFIIFFDVVGAAIVYSLILILQNLILLWYVRKKLNINPSLI